MPNDAPPYALVEVKRERGSGDPWRQLYTCYEEHVYRNAWDADGMRAVHDGWRFPMLPTSVDGPQVSPGAGVLGVQSTSPEPAMQIGDPWRPNCTTLITANIASWVKAFRDAEAAADNEVVDQAPLASQELILDAETVAFVGHLARPCAAALGREGVP